MDEACKDSLEKKILLEPLLYSELTTINLDNENFNLLDLIYLSRAAYNSTESKLDLEGIQISKLNLDTYKYYYISSTKTSFYTIETNYNKFLIIVFCGSNTLTDWIYNLYPNKEFPDTLSNTLLENVPDKYKFKLEHGWYIKFKSIQSILDKIINSHTGKIILTGHSLGAALALISSIYYCSKVQNQLCVIGFAMPNIGNEYLIDYCNQFINYIRVVDRSDIISGGRGDRYLNSKSIIIDLDKGFTYNLWNIRYHLCNNYINKIKCLLDNYNIIEKYELS